MIHTDHLITRRKIIINTVTHTKDSSFSAAAHTQFSFLARCIFIKTGKRKASRNRGSQNNFFLHLTISTCRFCKLAIIITKKHKVHNFILHVHINPTSYNNVVHGGNSPLIPTFLGAPVRTALSHTYVYYGIAPLAIFLDQ